MTQTPPPDRHWGAFTFGLAIGWAIGVVGGILKAPRSGAQTRRMISSGAEKIVGEITLEVERRGRQVVEELERDPVQEAIEAGKAAARELQAGRANAAAETPEEDEAR